MLRRKSVATEALDVVTGQRSKDYGDMAKSFGIIAKLWQPILGVDVTARQVALCMDQLKTARLLNSPGHRDSVVDKIGYMICYSQLDGGVDNGE